MASFYEKQFAEDKLEVESYSRQTSSGEGLVININRGLPQQRSAYDEARVTEALAWAGEVKENDPNYNYALGVQYLGAHKPDELINSFNVIDDANSAYEENMNAYTGSGSRVRQRGGSPFEVYRRQQRAERDGIITGEINRVVNFDSGQADASYVIEDTIGLLTGVGALTKGIAKAAFSRVQFVGSAGRRMPSNQIGAIGNVKGGVSNSKTTINIDPRKVGFSQTTVSYRKTRMTETGQKITYTYDDLVAGMKADGWNGSPLNVVRMPDGSLTSIDNTRLLAAREAGIEAKIIVHEFDQTIPNASALEYARPNKSAPKTWGEAIKSRIDDQTTTYYQDRAFPERFPNGSIYDPKVTGKR